MYGLEESSDLGAYSDCSLSQIRRGIESYLKKNPRSSVYFKSVITPDNPIEQFGFLNTRFNKTNVNTVDHGDHYEINITREIKRSGRTVSGSFAIFNHGDSQVWTALTAHDSDFFEHGLGWVISNS